MAFDRITLDHDKMGGLPCIRALPAEIVEDFPDLASGHAGCSDPIPRIADH